MLVVPCTNQHHLLAKRFSTKRDKRQLPYRLFYRQNVSLNDRDTSMLADGTKARFDMVTPAPGLESVAPELTAFVANQVFRFGSLGSHRSTKERTQGLRRGFLAKQGNSRDAAGKVIHRNGHPPAERPALRQGKRKPCTPIAGPRGNRCEINIPHVVGGFGCDNTRCGFPFFGGLRCCCWLLLEYTTDRGRGEMEPGPRKCVRDLLLAHGGA